MSKLIENADVAKVALASLVKMIGLLGAELVVGAHNDDIDRLESAVRAKLFASVDGVSPQATAEGVALAHRLVEPVLRDLRARVEARERQRGKVEAEPTEIPKKSPKNSASHLN